MNVHVIVPAAGAGRRFGADIKKQYLMLGDRPLLAVTLERLASHPRVDAITVVAPADELEYCRNEVIEHFGIDKVVGLVEGGAERQDSVRNGLQACQAADDDIVLIHDGVRPLLPLETLDALIDAAVTEGGSLLAIPAQDTIKEAADGQVVGTLDRSRLWQAQTPQAFRYERILDAHQRARQDSYQGTDDASLLEWCGWPVAVVPGSAYNLKVTTPEDLVLAKALLAAEEEETR